jgi:F-type H+-transporting ATPase subunit epsilon
MAQLKCVVVTPEKTLLDRSADFIAAPLYDGEKGIAPGHSPMIGRLGYGELRVREGGETVRYYIDAGFVQIANNVVTLLTSRAVPAASVNRQSAQQLLEKAVASKPKSEDEEAVRQREIAQARAMLRIAP